MKIIKISQGKETIIDDEDYERVMIRKWSFHHLGYVVGGYPQVSLHRFIMKAKKGKFIDHKNRNRLDNRKENLRFASNRQNQYNCIYNDGVHWRGDREAWIVRMNVNGRKKYIGYFKRKEDAELAHRKASLKYHKKFSPYYE